MKNRINKSDCNLRFLKCLEVLHIQAIQFGYMYIIIQIFLKNKGFLIKYQKNVNFFIKNRKGFL